MARYTKCYFYTRNMLPLMIGIIVGFAFSLLYSPFYDCDDHLSFSLFASQDNSPMNGSSNLIFRFRRRMHARSRQEQEQFDLLEQQHQKQIDEYEPRINLKGKPKKPEKPVQKLIRPRYASVELKVKEKLFVGIISTSRVLSSFATIQNQTISKHVNKLTFFVNNAEMNEKLLLETTPPGVNLVNFNDDRDNLLPFHSLKYAIDNYIENYDWFFFVTDNTFVRANKLLEFVNHLSISQDLYMGYSSTDEHSVYCSLSAGILFSNTLLRKILNKMEWCTKNSYSDNPTDNIGRCILHSTNLACSQSANGQDAIFHLNPAFSFDNEIDQLMESSPTFNKSLTVNLINNLETMKKLQLYFDRVEMDEIEAEIIKIENNIFETVCHTPEGCDSLIWPLGVPAPYKATSRHEVIRYDYFNQTHVFLGGDFDVVNEMSENYLQDVNEVIDFSLNNLKRNENGEVRYVLRKLLNGYKKLDPTRGASYVLDFLLLDKSLGIELHKRVNVMRPLGLIEIIPMPYVTESAKINLVVSFTLQDELKDIRNFFLSYQTYVLDYKKVADKVNLFVIYITQDMQDLNANEKKHYSYLNDTIKDLTKKYSSLIKTNSRIIQSHLQLVSGSSLLLSESYRQIQIAEYLSTKLTTDALVLIIPPCTELQPEFLNRVRLNTIKGSQIFYPIPFDEFMPNIIYPTKPFPEDVEIHKNIGYFNMDSYDHVSYYNGDYVASRNSLIKNLSTEANNVSISTISQSIDLYELFASNKNIVILRASDQELKCRWRLIDNCDKKMRRKILISSEAVDETEQQRCQIQRDNNLGTKAQLAMHLMKNFEFINQQ